MSKSLYDQLGGFTFVRRIVSDFYDRVLDDDDLNPFFESTDMASLIDHQTKFFAALLGGPASYTDEQLRALHARMEIQDHHFDTVIELMSETLEDLDMKQEHIDALVAELEARRGAIVVTEGAE